MPLFVNYVKIPLQYLPPANVVCEGYVFTGVCLSTGGGGGYPRMHCRSYDQAVYKQVHSWCVSVGVEAAYR